MLFFFLMSGGGWKIKYVPIVVNTTNMLFWVRILILLFAIAVVAFAFVDDTCGIADTFVSSPFYRCHESPCRAKGERGCCECPACAWFVDRHYHGRCVRRGDAPDSCLNRQHYASTYPRGYWYHPSNWAFWNSRPNPEVSCLAKDPWGRCIQPATQRSPPPRVRHRRGRRRHRRWL